MPRMCAGFLVRGADDNLIVRLAKMRVDMTSWSSCGGHTLHHS